MLALEEGIGDKSAVVGIVGVGYVGLPLAIAFAMAGFRVLRFDLLHNKITFHMEIKPHGAS